MTIASSILYAKKIFFSRERSSDDSAGQGGSGRRSLLGAVLCIGISLIPLVCVLVISDGMINGITGRIIKLSSQDLSVVINSYSPAAADAQSLRETAARFSQLDGVEASFPEVQGMALAAGKSSRSGATIRAVERDMFTANEGFSSLFTVVEGEIDLSQGRKAVIGEKIAQDLSIHAGDQIRIISVSSTGSRIVPKLSVFTVTAIVSCGYQELDALWVFIPLEEGYSVLNRSTMRCCVGLTTADAFSTSLGSVAQTVQNDIFGFGGKEDIEGAAVYRWDELNAAQFENFASTKSLLLVVMLLIVLVASVNISSALVMIVMERRKEIAILKSMGATSSGITLSFLIIGLAAGALGVVIGVPLGLLAAVNINGIILFSERIVNVCAKCLYILMDAGSDFGEIHLLDPAYYLQDIPVTIPLSQLFVIVLGTLLLSLAVSAVPAIKAGREKPLDTLRKL